VTRTYKQNGKKTRVYPNRHKSVSEYLPSPLHRRRRLSNNNNHAVCCLDNLGVDPLLPPRRRRRRVSCFSNSNFPERSGTTAWHFTVPEYTTHASRLFLPRDQTRNTYRLSKTVSCTPGLSARNHIIHTHTRTYNSKRYIKVIIIIIYITLLCPGWHSTNTRA